MDKKYKLVIPDIVDKSNIHSAEEFFDKDGEIITSYAVEDGRALFMDYAFTLPIEWLQEIKEPVTCEAWHTENQGKLNSTLSGGQVRMIWDAAIENYKLELEEKIQEKINSIPVINSSYIDGLKFIMDILNK